MIPLLMMLGLQLSSLRRDTRGKMIYIKNTLKILGHCGKANARLLGNAYGYEVIGKFEIC